MTFTINVRWSRKLGALVNSDWFDTLNDDERHFLRAGLAETETRRDLTPQLLEYVESYERAVVREENRNAR